jgi:putative membrane protein
MNRRSGLLVALVVLAGALTVSGWNPYSRLTWWLEIFPILLVVPLLCVTYKRFPLTTLLYVGIFVHAIVLMAGGKYTYARVPLGFQIADWFGWSRNPYDKIGHFFQGLVPALAVREIMVRGSYVRGRKMLVFVVICVVLAISAAYELIEWAAALVLKQGADEFLGTQGDQWDTQSDMFMALLGAIVTLTLFSKWHDRQIAVTTASFSKNTKDSLGSTG